MLAETPSERRNDDFVPVPALAHDLLQPLRAIVVNVQRIQRTEESLSAETKSRLDAVLAAARSQEALISALVEYDTARDESWIGDARSPLSLTLETACRNIDSFRKMQSGIIDIASPLPDVTVAPCIAKVLEKVMHNALKFREGQITPELKVEASDQDPGSIVIRVTDNGLGVESKYRQLIFRPFVRLNPTNDFPGAGLGLSICLQLMECIGGSIAFEDPEGSRGANVVIRFPATE